MGVHAAKGSVRHKDNWKAWINIPKVAVEVARGIVSYRCADLHSRGSRAAACSQARLLYEESKAGHIDSWNESAEVIPVLVVPAQSLGIRRRVTVELNVRILTVLEVVDDAAYPIEQHQVVPGTVAERTPADFASDEDVWLKWYWLKKSNPGNLIRVICWHLHLKGEACGARPAAAGNNQASEASQAKVKPTPRHPYSLQFEAEREVPVSGEKLSQATKLCDLCVKPNIAQCELPHLSRWEQRSACLRP